MSLIFRALDARRKEDDTLENIYLNVEDALAAVKSSQFFELLQKYVRKMINFFKGFYSEKLYLLKSCDYRTFDPM